MTYTENYQKWLNFAELPDYLREELVAMDEKTKEDAFYTNLEFGTAGMRGIIGAGTNRINIYVVRQATEGLAKLIETKGEDVKKRGVAIAYDSRHFSPEFAFESAQVLAKHGIKTYVFESLRPTPELSFAVRHLGTFAGIMVTASHNPAPFNGYKVYGEDGGQMPPADADALTDFIRAIEDPFAIELADLEESKASGLIEVIGEAVDAEYLKEVKDVNINQKLIDEYGKDMKIVYTPLHGTGNIPVRRVLKELGFENVYVVKEQELPDGDFPTVSYPNPESEEAFELAVKLGNEIGADILLATDPDADRLGVYVRGKESGTYHVLTGNMSGCLLAEYEISQMKEAGTLPEDGALIKTIVTTNLANDIAKYYNVNLIEVLTGFKYIGEQILGFETTGKGHYCFGFEESYGCLIGTHARDKDAVVATMALCEAVAYYKTKGMSLWDKMTEMYERYGYWLDGVQAITLKGKEGIEKIQNTIEKLRQQVPTEINGYKVLSARDYKLNTIKNMETGEVTETGLPKSNVLYYDLEGGAWVCVRPSGTEPKLKFYYGVKGTDAKDAEVKEKELGQYMINLVNSML